MAEKIFNPKFFILLLVFVAFAQSQVTMGPDTWVESACFCVPVGSCMNNMTSGSKNTASSGGSSSGTATTAATSATTVTAAAAATTAASNRRPDLEQSDGSINARIETNVNGTSSGNILNPNIAPVSSGVKPVVVNKTSCAAGLEVCCPMTGFLCGMRYPPIKSAPQPNETGQSNYGAYPWDVVVLSEKGEFIGGAVLIHNRYALTAAHKIYYSYNIKVRLGEWNTNASVEPFAPQEFAIPDNNVIFHPEFKSLKTLKNDIAILRIPAPGVQLGTFPTISHVCLPNEQLSNQRCWVSGWGKKNNTNESDYQTILKEVSLPLVNALTCQTQLQKTRLKESFVLDQSSFVCAGGEENIDACFGDGGSGLVCSVNGLFYLAGLVSWGIECGKADVPGVYVNIVSYIPWIQSTIRGLEGVSNSSTFTTTTKPITTTTKPTTTMTKTNSSSNVTTTTTKATTTNSSNVTLTTTASRNSSVTNVTTTTTKSSEASAGNVTTSSTPTTTKTNASNVTATTTVKSNVTTTVKTTVKTNSSNASATTVKSNVTTTLKTTVKSNGNVTTTTRKANATVKASAAKTTATTRRITTTKQTAG